MFLPGSGHLSYTIKQKYESNINVIIAAVSLRMDVAFHTVFPGYCLSGFSERSVEIGLTKFVLK